MALLPCLPPVRNPRRPAIATPAGAYLSQGRIWVKLSGPYRISARYPDYEDVQPMHEALLEANPDQLLWGTDWPHPRLAENMPDDGHLLDLFNQWTPDAALRKKILVDNPAKLYRFS